MSPHHRFTASGLLPCLHSIPVPHCLGGHGPLSEHSDGLGVGVGVRTGLPHGRRLYPLLFNKGNPQAPCVSGRRIVMSLVTSSQIKKITF